MHPRFRRFALVLATVGLVVSLFLALRPDEGDDEAAQTTTTMLTTTTTTTTTSPPPATTTAPPTSTTTAPPPTTTARPDPAFDTVRVNVVAGRPRGGVQRATVEQGRDVVIVVRSDVSDHVHLHGYDLMVDVEPGTPARLRFTADVPGRFEVELEDRGVPIADIQVRP